MTALYGAGAGRGSLSRLRAITRIYRFRPGEARDVNVAKYGNSSVDPHGGCRTLARSASGRIQLISIFYSHQKNNRTSAYARGDRIWRFPRRPERSPRAARRSRGTLSPRKSCLCWNKVPPRGPSGLGRDDDKPCLTSICDSLARMPGAASSPRERYGVDTSSLPSFAGEVPRRGGGEPTWCSSLRDHVGSPSGLRPPPPTALGEGSPVDKKMVKLAIGGYPPRRAHRASQPSHHSG